MICKRRFSVAESVYRCMLVAYPFGFRERYGQEMVEAFRQGQSSSYEKRGLGGLLRFWLFIFGDWIHSSRARVYCLALSCAAALLCSIVLPRGALLPVNSSQFAAIAQNTKTLKPLSLIRGQSNSRGVYKIIRPRLQNVPPGLKQRSLPQGRVFHLKGSATVLGDTTAASSLREFTLVGSPSLSD